jgi:MFS family permease
MTFLSINAVITYFLNILGASTFQISLANALVSIGNLVAQPIFSRMSAGLPYKSKVFTRILLVQRIFFLVYVMTIPLFTAMNPRYTVVAFLICWAIFNFFTGSYSPFYMVLFSKMVDGNESGRLRGFSGAIANAAALGSAYITSVLLKNLVFPYNYTVVFAIGAILLILDGAEFLFFVEPPDEPAANRMSYLQYIRDIPQALSANRTLLVIIIASAFFVISNVSLAFYELYALRCFNARENEVALFMGITVLINTLGNILFGLISDRYSHRLVLLISSLCGVLAGLTVLSITSIYGVYAAFALANLCSCGYILSTSMLVLGCSRQKEIPINIGIYGIITLIATSLVTLSGSFIIDRFSFKPLFLITGAAGLGAFIVMFFFYRVKTGSRQYQSMEA